MYLLKPKETICICVFLSVFCFKLVGSYVSFFFIYFILLCTIEALVSYMSYIYGVEFAGKCLAARNAKFYLLLSTMSVNLLCCDGTGVRGVVGGLWVLGGSVGFATVCAAIYKTLLYALHRYIHAKIIHIKGERAREPN